MALSDGGGGWSVYDEGLWVYGVVLLVCGVVSLVCGVVCGGVMVGKNMLGDMGEVWDRCPCREGSELSCDGGVRGGEGGDTRALVGGHGRPDQDDGVVGDGAHGGVTDGGMDDCFVWDDVNGVGKV